MGRGAQRDRAGARLDKHDVLLTARKFRVERRAVPARDGSFVTQEFVVHPGAAVVLPILPDGRILLIRNRRPSVQQTLVELPAGTLEPGESPEACAARELEEETGYAAGALQPLISFLPSPGIMTERMHIFVATELRAGEAHLEPGESIELAPQTWDEALAQVRAGRIVDGKTIVGLLFYDRFARGGGA